MNTIRTLFFIVVLGLVFAPCASAQNGTPSGGNAMNKTMQETKIRIRFNSGEAVVALFDNPVSRDFASLLPMAVTFEDYARTEKITYLPRKLTTQGGVTAGSTQGDFTYYAPWGNLAAFYKGFGKGGELYILGRIESGKENLAAMSADFSATIEILE